jgi:hypothetical protein
MLLHLYLRSFLPTLWVLATSGAVTRKLLWKYETAFRSSQMLTRVWQELEYLIDVCRVTRGANIERL